MKKIAALVILVSMILSVMAWAASDKEMVFFEDFEEGLSGWNCSKEEYRDKFTFVTDFVSEGKSALKLTDDVTDDTVNLISSDFPAEENQEYTLIYDACVAEGKCAKVYLQFKDEEGTLLYSKSMYSSGADWKAYTNVHTSPKGTKKGCVVIWGQDADTGVTLFDNIRISKGISYFLPEVDVDTLIQDKNKIDVLINGCKVEFDVEPCIINSRTMVPMRAVFEEFGAEVVWDELTFGAKAVKGDKVVEITKNSDTAYVNGEEHKLDSPAVISDGRFLVPLRFISEAFGASVNWIDETKTVVIVYE